MITETWRARVYVNRVGTWEWDAWESGGQLWDGDSGEFTAVEAPASGLRGMLRASAVTETMATAMVPPSSGLDGESTATNVGTPKRWYTDDGRTFLPMADTAYRLFWDRPDGITVTEPGPPGSGGSANTITTCTYADPVRTVDNKPLWQAHVEDMAAKGINVLRAESLGNWVEPAWWEVDSWGTVNGYTKTHYANAGWCPSSYRLFFDDDPTADYASEFDFSALDPNEEAWPNQISFARTDERLKWLLDHHPDIYIQVILLPAMYPYDEDDGFWKDVDSGNRVRLWQTMLARWAAFPNVLWTVTNDSEIFNQNSDYQGKNASRDTPNTRWLATEVGCYFLGDSDSLDCESDLSGYSITSLPEGQDPWRRPLSVGHRRNNRPDLGYAKKPDYFATVDPRSWNTYITAYGYHDAPADQMDLLEWDSSGLYYVAEDLPTYNTEDIYEDSDPPSNKPYYYRRLFWSHLLSGSGATYGGGGTFRQEKTYSEAGQTGLDNIEAISNTLAAARIDLRLFKPGEYVDASGSIAAISPLGTSPVMYKTAAYNTRANRIQIAYRDRKEILAYIPNSSQTSDTATDAPANSSAEVDVDLTDFDQPTYAVTWYNPTTGINTTGVITTISGGTGGTSLTAPFNGDAVLHISSRCESPNVCLSMDIEPENYSEPDDGFQIKEYTATLALDQTQHVFGGQDGIQPRASWRCDRPVGAPEDYRLKCLLYFLFPSEKPIASADYYFRRNSKSGHQSVAFMTAPSPTAPITFTDEGWPASAIDVGFNPEGDVFSNWGEWGYPVTLNVRHGVPLELNRWYHLEVKATKKGDDVDDRHLEMEALLDGVSIFTSTESFRSGDQFLRGVVLDSAWWGPISDLDSSIPITPSIWWDELTIDPPPDSELQGLYRTYFQQGLGHYAGNQATWFDGSGGYNDTSLLHVGANNWVKSLLHFDLSALPANAIVDEAKLQFYYAGRSNGNTLTLGAHRVLAEWVDSEANRIQRKSGVNWQTVGMGAGSDCTATAEATANVAGSGGAWVEMDLTAAAQAWVADPASNHGLVLLQEAASDYVTYDFCSELGWSPCTAAQAPELVVWYRP